MSSFAKPVALRWTLTTTKSNPAVCQHNRKHSFNCNQVFLALLHCPSIIPHQLSFTIKSRLCFTLSPFLLTNCNFEMAMNITKH